LAELSGACTTFCCAAGLVHKKRAMQLAAIAGRRLVLAFVAILLLYAFRIVGGRKNRVLLRGFDGGQLPMSSLTGRSVVPMPHIYFAPEGTAPGVSLLGLTRRLFENF